MDSEKLVNFKYEDDIWVASLSAYCLKIFDCDGDQVLSLTYSDSDIPSEYMLLLLIAAYKKGEAVGTQYGENRAQKAIQNALGLGAIVREVTWQIRNK